jgi:microsomal dipeptidase-like Zn-dependent dipeptidase
LLLLVITFTATAQYSKEDIERAITEMEKRGDLRREGNNLIIPVNSAADSSFYREMLTNMFKGLQTPYRFVFEVKGKNMAALKGGKLVAKKDTTPTYVAVLPTVRAATGITQFQYLKNGDFEQGYNRSIPGWTIKGKSFRWKTGTDQYTWEDFDVVPDATVGGDYWRDIKFHTGYKHQHWISSMGEAVIDNPNTATGTFTSDPFKIYPNQNFLSFLVSGGKDIANLKVELLEYSLRPRLTGNVNVLLNNQRPIPGTPQRNQSIGNTIDTVYSAIPGIEAKTGHNNDIFRRDWWDIHMLDTAKQYAVRITDNAGSTINKWGHINVDDVRLLRYNPQANREDDSLQLQTIDIKDFVTGQPQSIITDLYVPLYGAGDMHTHLMSHLAMGHKLLYGAPDIGSIVPAGTYFCNPENYKAETVEQCLGNCNAAHGGWGMTDNGCGNYIRAAVLNHAFDSEFENRVPFERNAHGDHPHEGYPNFTHWPHFSSASHQQMYVDWIKRAYEGGLRVMVTLTVNSELLGAVLSGDGPMDDKNVANMQLDEIQAFVDRHQDFMQIARTPQEMRKIIRSNKMAIIIGMEVDNIGNFNYANVMASESAVKAEIQRLYNKGVRYIFPIHLVNNKFGGSAIYSLLFNLSNKYTNSRPLPFGAPIPPGLMFQVDRATDPRINYTLNLFNAPTAGAMNAAIAGINIVFDGISEIPYPPALNIDPTSGDFCPIPKLGCIQQFKIIKSLLVPDPAWDIYNSIPGGQQNRQGLTTLGQFAIKEMMKLGMIIDIDHMSDHSVAGALELANSFEYPVISGHNNMRDAFFEHADHKVSENQRTTEQLQNVSKLGGLFGLGIAEATAGQYLTNFRIAMRKMGNVAITMGSDINGFVTMTKPRHGPARVGVRSRYTGAIYNNWSTQIHYALAPAPGLRKYTFGNKTWDYNTEGIAHIGLYPDFYQDLKNLGMSQTERQVFFSTADYFVNMWETCIRKKAGVR